MNPPLPLPVSPLPSMSFCTVSINANGLSHPRKINAIQNMVSSLRPHALVVGETKSSQKLVLGYRYLTMISLRTLDCLAGSVRENGEL